MIKILVYVLTAFGLTFMNLESSIAYWRYLVGLSPFQTFVVAGIISSCFIVFWFWISEKILKLAKKLQEEKRIQKTRGPKKILLIIARRITKKRNVYEKRGNKKTIKIIHAWGHFGIYLCGVLPSFTFFMIGLGVQKLLIQTKLGYWCLWLGAMTRLAIGTFAGLKLIDVLAKLIT